MCVCVCVCVWCYCVFGDSYKVLPVIYPLTNCVRVESWQSQFPDLQPLGSAEGGREGEGEREGGGEGGGEGGEREGERERERERQRVNAVISKSYPPSSRLFIIPELCLLNCRMD